MKRIRREKEKTARRPGLFRRAAVGLLVFSVIVGTAAVVSVYYGSRYCNDSAAAPTTAKPNDGFGTDAGM